VIQDAHKATEKFPLYGELNAVLFRQHLLYGWIACSLHKRLQAPVNAVWWQADVACTPTGKCKVLYHRLSRQTFPKFRFQQLYQFLRSQNTSMSTGRMTRVRFPVGAEIPLSTFETDSGIYAAS